MMLGDVLVSGDVVTILCVVLLVVLILFLIKRL